MPKRIDSSVAFPKAIGPNDPQLERATADLTVEVDNDLQYLLDKQKKIRSYLKPLLEKKSNPLPKELLETLEKTDTLARLAQTRLKRVRDTVKTQSSKMVEHRELGKSAIIREVVQARRAKVNWFGPKMIVTPMDETIAERQCTLNDRSVDILELEQAHEEQMEI